MTDSDVKDMVVRAWENAWKNAPPAANRAEKEVHRERSAGWVDALAKELKCLYEKDDRDIRVFWKGGKEKDFGTSKQPRREMLFDVAVCQVKETISIKNYKTLYFISKCLWLLESELANNSKEILIDLSKLVMGSSEMKLFVAGIPLWKGRRRKEREEQILKMCRKAADRCGEPLYFCFIPYPKKWTKANTDVYGPSLWLRKEARLHKV